MPAKVQNARESLPFFVSDQVTQARRFFLNLQPDRKAGLAVVCGGVERMSDDYLVDRTDFPYYAVELVAEGEGTLTIGGGEHRLTPGSVFAYGPQTPHTIRNRSPGGMRKYYVDFVGVQCLKRLREIGLVSGARNQLAFARISVAAFFQLVELFELMIRDATQSSALSDGIASAQLSLLLLKLQQLRVPDAHATGASYATFEKIRQHMDEHFLEITSARQLASRFEVTPVHLSRLFRRFSDYGAYQYLMRLKMNHAAGLLMNEGLLVKEVAHRLRFRDAFQFSRAFKRVYGVAPVRLIEG